MKPSPPANTDEAQEKPSPSRARAKKEQLDVHWSSDDVEQARATLLRNLSAKKRFWDTKAKDYVEVPDSTAQIAAALALLNQSLGMPVQRILRVEANFKDRHAELLEIA